MFKLSLPPKKYPDNIIDGSSNSKQNLPNLELHRNMTFGGQEKPEYETNQNENPLGDAIDNAEAE